MRTTACAAKRVTISKCLYGADGTESTRIYEKTLMFYHHTVWLFVFYHSPPPTHHHIQRFRVNLFRYFSFIAKPLQFFFISVQYCTLVPPYTGNDCRLLIFKYLLLPVCSKFNWAIYLNIFFYTHTILYNIGQQRAYCSGHRSRHPTRCVFRVSILFTIKIKNSIFMFFDGKNKNTIWR